MVGRTQQESEQPAKVYQLDAVNEKVSNLIDISTKMTAQMEKILDQTNGLVTQSQLMGLEKDFEDKLQNHKKEVDLKYGPMKRNASRLLWIIISAIVAQIIAAVFVFLKYVSKT